ncbi:hypothetical protein [Streptomyces sp. HNM0574]|uniref:hypothetical protein n=1 Tax=Streptomyces sp. HNM0574 TaxID=2714954 RepID=UPI00146B9B2D|nr:hypothetical protein [Streptomyces sp. HNM0574]NLU68795.1 hypothetical protein [Streptomyces sp. HNM0574]
MHPSLTALLNRRPGRPAALPCDGLVHDDAALVRAARGALTRTEQIRRVAATLCGADVGWACARCTRRAERLLPGLVGELVP